MPSPFPPDDLVEDRVAQLEAINQRRNALLREMYHLMRRRQNVGFVFRLNESDEEDFPKFLDRLDLRKNPETGTLASFLDSDSAGSDSPRRHTPYEVRMRSRSVATTTPPNVKPPASDPGAERRASLRRDVRKPRMVVDIDDHSSVSPPASRQSAAKTGDEAESDDVLAMEPPSPQQSRPHSSSLPPHHYQDEDDDDRDELDLISPSPRSGTSYEPRTRSSTQVRSRSLSAVIDISDSPSPAEVLESEPHEGDDGHEAPKSEEVMETRKDADGDVILIIDEEGSSAPEEVQIEARQPPELLKLQVQVHEDSHPEVQQVSEEQRSSSVTDKVHPVPENNDQVIDMLVPVQPQGRTEVPTSATNDMPKDTSQPVVVSATFIEQGQDQIDVVQSSASEPQDVEMRLENTLSQETQPSRTPSTISPSQIMRSISIPAPSPPAAVVSSYDFNMEANPVSARYAESRTRGPTTFEPHYTLPPLKSLPIEFQRRSKIAKQQRKKEKEREKNGVLDKADGRKDSKEDCIPMGWNRWAATLRANPVWKKVNRASKCLSSRDWSVAIAELRLVRTFERVETLKNGQWSFRQPKKQRGVGGLTKSHWDYLMDEMKWMRIDFREERRWKIMLAYNLAEAVLEWHEAGSLVERVRRGICVLWKPPHVTEMDDSPAEPAEDPMDIDSQAQITDANSLSIVEYGSDDDDDDDEPEKEQDVIDALQPTTTIQEALEQASQNAVDSVTLEPKKEEMDHSSTLQAAQSDDHFRQVTDDIAQGETMEVDETPKVEESLVSNAINLKPTSADPILASEPQSLMGNDERPSSGPKSSNKSKVYAPIRERIAYSDERKLFLDLDDLNAVVLSPAQQSSLEALSAPVDISEVFSDLPLYGLLDVAQPFTASLTSEGKRKSEKKSERDDPNKRAEDTTYTKLTHLGRFMYTRPTLLGPLQPAKHWHNGQWSNLDECPVSLEGDIIVRPPDDISCGLFEGSKPSHSLSLHTPFQSPQHRKRFEHTWTERDDALLKSIVERYPNNWSLVCDAFNSSRITIPTDRRHPSDCLQRWLSLRDAEKPLPPTPTQTMMTRGIKRPINTNLGPNGSSPSSGFDTKKRRHHLFMYEAIRKAAKKREVEKKASMSQRKPSSIHDTHGQYNKMPKLTPAELSRLKAEKEQREDQEMMLTKRRNEEFRQLREQHHRMQNPNLQQQSQQQQMGQQSVNGAPRAPTLGIPSAQGVPQIRNISQQQRIPTPLSAANARLSPQQMIHAQAQAAQARALAAAQAQAAQAQVVAAQTQVPNINGVVGHMSPPYASRAATSSPALSSSPPRNANTPSNAVNLPRPPSAQPPTSSNMTTSVMSQVPVTSIPRAPTNLANLGHFFPAQFTPEQMEQAIRFQLMQQAQRQAGIAQNNSSQSGSFPSQSQ